MELENFRLDVADGIATVVFDRAPVNAQNLKTREEFIRLFDALGDRDDVRVVILTGKGDMFSAGADIKERVDMVKEPGDYTRNNRVVREFFYAARDCARPVIAAVNGPALGAFALPAMAQKYPANPIPLVNPYAAGGPADVLARTVIEPMQADLGQSIVLLNKAGGGILPARRH